ncbi:MAG: ADOP family duplicated permease [Gemmatimonadota bacterium]
MSTPHAGGTGPSAPPPPRWVRVALSCLLPKEEIHLIRSELEELYALTTARHGAVEARRRVLRQWRGYPARLLWARLRGGSADARRASGGTRPWPTPTALRQSARSLARAPLLTGTIVATVGLGIAGCTAIFSLIDALYLRPLPYPDADRVMALFTDAPPNRFPFSVVDLQALEAGQTSFAAVGAYGRSRRTLITDAGAESIATVEVTPGLLDVLGLAPLAGRLPGEVDGQPGAAPTVMVTDGFARRVLGRTGVDAVGASLVLDGETWQVLGVLPDALGPLAREVQVLPTLRLEPPTRKGPFFLRPFGRLREGVSPATAAAELRVLNAQLFPLWADSYTDQSASWGLMPIAHSIRGDVGRLLALVLAAVGTVLLIALANAANLLVARQRTRAAELAVRAALGATPARIRAHLFTESLLLAAGGVLVGLVAARAAIAVLPLIASRYVQGAEDATLSANAVLFALGLSALSALVFVLVPAVHDRRGRRWVLDLRAGGRGGTERRAQQRVQRLLVAAQVALVMPLLASAVLLLRTFVALERVDPGFDVERLVSMQVSLSPTAYPDRLDRQRFWDAALVRLEALPGVERVALASERPPDDVNDINNFDLEDRPTAPGEPARLAAWVGVGPGFFETMGIPLREGRSFTSADRTDDAPPVLVADEAWARRNYAGETALGRRLYTGGQTSGPRASVVGVVASVPYQGIGASDLGALYAPTDNGFGDAFLLVRASGDADAVAAAVQDALRRLDPTLPVSDVASGPALLQGSLARPRHLTLLAAVFAGVALILSVVGIYGVTANAVQRRRGDIAVRLALGGQPGTVLGVTLREGLQVALTGLAVGALATLLITRGLTGLLYGVSPADPLALGAAGALLLLVSLVATLVPALRAVRLDPATVLRGE